MRKICFFNLLSALLLFITLILFVLPTNAQEASSSNTNQAVTPSPTIQSAPTPIPLSNIVTQAEITSRRLDEIQNSLSDNPEIGVIEKELPQLRDELSLRSKETDELLTNQPSLETLRKVEQDWRSLSSSIPAWKDDLKTQADVLDKQIGELKNFGSLWNLTLQTLENSAPNPKSASLTESSETQDTTGIPVEILKRIRETIIKIKQTQTSVEEEQNKLLTLQTQVSEEESLVNQTLETVNRVREEALTHLLIRDSPAIWNVDGDIDSFSSLIKETRNSFISQIRALNEYAYRQSDRFILHAAILILLIGALFWGRKGVRPKVVEEPKLKQATVVFEYPISTALILTILLSGWLYPQAPRILSSLLGAAALVPGIVILRNLIEKSLFSILNALMIFYFIDRVREITESLPLVSRILFMAEMLGAILFLVWVLRSKRLSGKIQVKHQRIFTTIKKIIPFALAIFIGAFLANILGFVSLARIIGNGILGSAYIALVLYTALQIAESLLIFAVRVRPLSLSVWSKHIGGYFRTKFCAGCAGWQLSRGLS